MGVGGNDTPRLLYPREKEPVLIVEEAGWAPGAVYWQKITDIPFHLRTIITTSKSTSKIGQRAAKRKACQLRGSPKQKLLPNECTVQYQVSDKYLFSAAHAGWQQWYHRKHVLERVDHGDKRHHRHGKCVVVTRL
jgi:hypothetical protein